LRETFRLDLALDLDPQDLLSVDESAATCAMTRRYARAPRGERAIDAVPRNHGTPTTRLAALAPTGVQAAVTGAGAVDAPVFRAFVGEVLAPTLRPGQVVAVDNLSVHLDPEAARLIEARDCLLLLLPAYSPDFAPIEPAFSKIKAHVRQVAPRVQDALDEAIAAAIQQITPEDARGFFKHCGYPLPAQ
jgi:transposase